MKMSRMYLPTLREVPAEAVIVSHRLLLRAGMIRKLSNGLFTYLPLGLRAFRKVENIIREEMNAIGCLEFKPSVVVPGDIWRESGRWETMGEGMLRVTNRVAQELVVSPTAEEAFTAVLRSELASYKQYPLAVYQINSKYRDEIRPRYGLMRSREFTMKDAYSYHTNEASLDASYQAFGQAYRRIFRRNGLSVIPVRADSGAMGGSGSEEFMVESAVGDNNLILCPDCGYAANDEKAACAPDLQTNNPTTLPTSQPLTAIATPEVRTIDQLTAFLNTVPQAFIKTLIYRAVNCELDLSAASNVGSLKRVTPANAPTWYPEAFFAVCVRGDLDVNEVKLAAVLKASEVALAADLDVERLTGAPVGFAGPVGLTGLPVLADPSVMALHDAVTGALQADLHFTHVEPGRDFSPWLVADVRTVKAGDRCVNCGAAYYGKKGNELGHIFKLGNKYTKSMGMSYLDENGKQQVPIMGCYGIGVDRTLASIIEEHHDADGIVWPMSVAPFQVAIVPIKYEGVMRQAADRLYGQLAAAGIEVLLDDREERPGVKFKDMDLIGIPVRIVVGDKNLPNVEVKLRSGGELRLIPLETAATEVHALVWAALEALMSGDPA
ncbi:MAG: proline--tRNA ligase [Spirochaetes bacterium GWD1_61_31]|nr:MAG: proline--tRNA ligase [Spirochaetes bacterium GWB1_60_80]OHD34253.1 MAG: proline--tRNA ligase [Spirochaetes bacterium GWC1_61_12]OHD40181.1 MAG: proline--tRNA ligase [Spirochaetes bacterium GWD1_61_31]OHD45771.1 MAG: proline--tRNA ligase [Spirochaetes bacterium GWE1_60_18]OHD58315.1 MAG: proline--tRNA ligase [Spirochaetes bacterium GWF1_60_12]HAX37771.1 proline--tRNA ligase [Spirochaetaceae bacterium]